MRRSTRALAAVAALPLIVTGCSSSSSNGSAKQAVTNPKLTGAPIVVGTIGSFSGPQSAALALLPQTMQAWESWTNAHNGINGHPVKLIIKDDGSDPATALKDAKELVEQDHVVAIVGESSLVDATWASYVQQQGVPVVGGISLETPFLTNPDFYASGTSVPVMMVGELAEMKARNLKHLGVMYCAESPVCAQLGGLAQLSSQLTGGTIKTTTASVAATSPSYDAQCLTMKNANVDALMVGANSTVVTRVADACANLGYKPITINESPTFARDWLSDANLDGAVLISPNANYVDAAVPGVKDFLAALSAYAPNVQGSPQFSYDNIYPWAGGQLFAAAAKAANLSSTSTPADVKKGLYALKNETLDGIAPPLNFTPGQPSMVPCYFVTQMKSGKLISAGTAPQCLSATQLQGLATALKALG